MMAESAGLPQHDARRVKQMKNENIPVLTGQGFAFEGRQWRFDAERPAAIVMQDETVLPFSAAASVTETPFTSGLGQGVRTVYSGFEAYPELSFETQMLVDATTGYVDCTLVPLRMDCAPIREVMWPQPLVCDDANAYAVVNTMQGQLIPTDWPAPVGENLPFGGQMCSESAYMPWWGEVAPDGAYLCYVRQAWDAAYTISHPAGGPNRVFVRHLPSLGRMRYARTVTYCFAPAGSDYVTLCKMYRAIAEEEGRVLTLRQKAALNPMVDKLIGACVMHVPGKTHVTSGSRFYNREEPEKNDRLVPFAHWEERVRRLHAMGVDKLYLHLDGWGQPGYDNQHPDYLPPCKELGGWEGMKSLSDTMQELGYMFGIHDQYRDYYLDAPTYDIDNAAQRPDGSVYEMSVWAGGRQNYLCASQAPSYVRRNFEELFAHGIHLEGTYLDVFTCNEPDECANPRHPMTRRECLEYRGQALNYLTAHHVAPSSEEVNDWAIPYQVFCHWAPYISQTAIPAPLFNLVWHDCVIIPWFMEAGTWGIPEGTTGFLHCLLGGGMGYMSEEAEGEALDRNIEQWKVISELQQHVAREQMVSHAFLNDDRTRQRTVFTGGTTVEVDFANNTYSITYP